MVALDIQDYPILVSLLQEQKTGFLLTGIEWKLRLFSLSFLIFLCRLRVTGRSLNKS